jgi:hypothetical protein
MFPFLKGFLEETSIETSDAGIYRYTKDHLVNLQSAFCKNFPEALIHTNGLTICSMLIPPRIRNFFKKKKKKKTYLMLL